MNITTIITAFLASLAGGGLGVALIDWWRTNRSETRQRQIDFADRQIRELYGPLYYITSQSERLFSLNEKIHNAYKAEYIVPKFSDDERTRKVLEEDISRTLETGNSFIKMVVSNNQKIDNILQEKSSLMDSDDIDIFLLFYEHKIRLELEFTKEGKLQTPLLIYQHLGDISFLRPEVVEHVKKKYIEKKSMLERLVGA